MYKEYVSYADTCNFKVQDIKFKVLRKRIMPRGLFIKDQAAEVNEYVTRLTKTKMKVLNKVGTSYIIWKRNVNVHITKLHVKSMLSAYYQIHQLRNKMFK
jgi:hypothetical protein